LARKKNKARSRKKTSKVNINTSEYKDHLISFLNYVASNGDIDQSAQNMRQSASFNLQSLHRRYGSANWQFNTKPCWKIDVCDKEKFGDYPTYLLIGGNIVVGGGTFQKYSLSTSLVIRGSKSVPPSTKGINMESCCLDRHRDYNRIVRRFHFDIDNPSKCKTPYSHLQVGGEFNPSYAPPAPQPGYHYCFDHYIEIPRLPYPPIDMVILLDTMLRQFETKVGENILSDGTWLKLVKKSQILMLNDYYMMIQSHLVSDYPKSDEWYNWTLNDVLCGGKLV